MGNLDKMVGQSANNIGYSVNLTTTWFNTASNQKYYDLYSSSQFTGSDDTNIQFCTLEACGGHALFETASWYGDYAGLSRSDLPWLYRGGSYAGAFASTRSGGYASVFYGFRTVAVVGQSS